jgi:hypothetical protein
MILGNSSLLNAAGTSGSAVFLIDMNKAFEDFVASRLTRYLHGQLLVRTQQPDQLDTGGNTRIIPDLTFEHRPGLPAYVADTKYKIGPYPLRWTPGLAARFVGSARNGFDTPLIYARVQGAVGSFRH